MAKYANVIVDISLDKLDKTFQYLIPEELKDTIREGMQVEVPFGNRSLAGFVMELTDEAEFDESKLKPVTSLKEDGVAIESQLIALAAWIRRNYGGTMNQALKTVLPIKQKSKAVEQRSVRLLISKKEAQEYLALFEAKHNTAKARLLRELIEQDVIQYQVITQKLHVTASVVKGLEEKGILALESQTAYRNPIRHLNAGGYDKVLNAGQQHVVDVITDDMQREQYGTYLLKGVTGSGKTEVYMELISHVLRKGKQAIVLIPEIALTYQTVMRFYNRFGKRVSIMNSRLSAGERYDQFLRAKNGDVDIMIGPRSALFTPFTNLGLIIIDEEHETSYKSETVPRYHARETAIARAAMNRASVVLGSATPSVESYYKAKQGYFKLLELNERVQKRPLPECEVIDLREELRSGNRSILSTRLQELMDNRLRHGQQTMLFLNRRGVAGFVSCRACGHVIRCPHCDVSLSQHAGGRMVCHYCGYEQPEPKVCPECGSGYIGGFKAGTQKVEEIVKKRFPKARVLRMDYDTTRTKDSYEKILSAFSNQEADILIGTQMIVKGHDFPNVTLVGVLAADMSLHVSDFHAAERTFELLTQAAGRAGRGESAGQVIIQTYDPEHYAIEAAKDHDYETFYEKEITYRSMLRYPPVANMLLILCTSEKEEAASQAAYHLAESMQKTANREYQLMGPADASIRKIHDIYRKVIYIKAADYELLVELKDKLEHYMKEENYFRNVMIQFDFNPMNGW